ncbi:MAG: class I SAM-dependent methyltransferase [Gaiellaceae bacterium]
MTSKLSAFRRGCHGVGVDASPTLIRLAADAHPEGQYVRCDAAALPFEEGSFDLAVASARWRRVPLFLYVRARRLA